MENNIKVSIVIPVYNMEKHLEQCIDSILNQSLEDIEIICVDDGSTDKSSNILEKYSKRDDRIKIIFQKNKGQGAARNKGLENVKGEYVSFIDSDDWVDKNMLKDLYNNAHFNNTDITMCQVCTFDDVTEKFDYNSPYFSLDCFSKEFDNKIFTHEDTKDFFLSFTVTAWNKIYKKDFLDEIGINFPELIFEDSLFFVDTYLRAKRISLVKKFLYFYRINKKDSTIGVAGKEHFDLIKISNLIMESLVSSGNYETYKKRAKNWNIEAFNLRYSRITEIYKNDFFNLIKENLSKWDKDSINCLNKHNKILFDSFLLADTYREFDLMKQNQKLNRQINKEKNKINALKKEKESLVKENKKNQKELNEIYSSRIWKLTKPFRKQGV